MYGKFVLFDDAGKLEKGEQVYLGELKGKNEAWLRDMLFENPEIIPIDDIDPTFGPLVPVCKELRTDAGQIDALFINERGRLTIVECKLWKNPQARREVVAQTLDYISALCHWSDADLQKWVVNNVGGKQQKRQTSTRQSVARARKPIYGAAFGRWIVANVRRDLRSGALRMNADGHTIH